MYPKRIGSANNIYISDTFWIHFGDCLMIPLGYDPTRPHLIMIVNIKQANYMVKRAEFSIFRNGLWNSCLFVSSENLNMAGTQNQVCEYKSVLNLHAW